MVGTQKCSFCGKDIEPGTGSAFVQTKDGAVFWFCSNKCKVNRMKRRMKPRDTKWTTGFIYLVSELYSGSDMSTECINGHLAVHPNRLAP